MLGGIGTSGAAVGAAILVLELATKALDREIVLTGALLVLGGLLLRIWAAVWGGSGTGRAPER
jgi:hypothetical protein